MCRMTKYQNGISKNIGIWYFYANNYNDTAMCMHIREAVQLGGLAPLTQSSATLCAAETSGY